MHVYKMLGLVRFHFEILIFDIALMILTSFGIEGGLLIIVWWFAYDLIRLWIQIGMWLHLASLRDTTIFKEMGAVDNPGKLCNHVAYI